MEEITREKIMSTINAPKNIKEYVECRIAELLGLRCYPQYDCRACTKESMRIIINAWEKEVIDLKLENKNMCSRQDLITEKRKTAAKEMERSRLQNVNKWLVGALDAASYGAERKPLTCFFDWRVFDAGLASQREAWWCTGCRDEVDTVDDIPPFCPNCGRRVC